LKIAKRYQTTSPSAASGPTGRTAGNPGAVINEVMAVTRRLIEGLVSLDNCPDKIGRLFNGAKGIKQTRTKLRTGSDIHRTLGVPLIRAYLGQGNPNHSHRARDDAAKAFNTSPRNIQHQILCDVGARQ
jgi:hypothetical protein